MVIGSSTYINNFCCSAILKHFTLIKGRTFDEMKSCIVITYLEAISKGDGFIIKPNPEDFWFILNFIKRMVREGVLGLSPDTPVRWSIHKLAGELIGTFGGLDMLFDKCSYALPNGYEYAYTFHGSIIEVRIKE